MFSVVYENYVRWNTLLSFFRNSVKHRMLLGIKLMKDGLGVVGLCYPLGWWNTPVYFDGEVSTVETCGTVIGGENSHLMWATTSSNFPEASQEKAAGTQLPSLPAELICLCCCDPVLIPGSISFFSSTWTQFEWLSRSFQTFSLRLGLLRHLASWSGHLPSFLLPWCTGSPFWITGLYYIQQSSNAFYNNFLCSIPLENPD